MVHKKISLNLLRAAVSATKHAYAPYSNFLVGAAVETISGEIYLGANMENSSYGLTSCAEVGAVQAALTAGKFTQIVRIAIVGGKKDQTTNDVITPCGRCRQVIFESSQQSGTDIDVICADLQLTSIKQFKISELLPSGFSQSHLAGDELKYSEEMTQKYAHSK